MSNFIKLGGTAAISALLAFTTAASVNARVPEIPQSLYDRYGERDRSNSGITRSDENCKRHEDLLNGRIYQNEFNNGHGRTTLSLSERNGGSVKFEIELSTGANGLPSRSCDIF